MSWPGRKLNHVNSGGRKTQNTVKGRQSVADGRTQRHCSRTELKTTGANARCSRQKKQSGKEEKKHDEKEEEGKQMTAGSGSTDEPVEFRERLDVLNCPESLTRACGKEI